MDRKFIVINVKGLNVRSKPDTKTGQIVRFMTNGMAFIASDVFTVGTETWARLTRADNSIQEYCLIEKTGTAPFAKEQFTQPSPSTGSSWQQALDKWARDLGFNGPKP